MRKQTHCHCVTAIAQQLSLLCNRLNDQQKWCVTSEWFQPNWVLKRSICTQWVCSHQFSKVNYMENTLLTFCCEITSVFVQSYTMCYQWFSFSCFFPLIKFTTFYVYCTATSEEKNSDIVATSDTLWKREEDENHSYNKTSSITVNPPCLAMKWKQEPQKE